MTETTPPAPAGWYPDSQIVGQQRYWDGAQWTEHVAPVAGPQAAAPPPSSTGTNVVLIVVGVVVAGFLLIIVLIAAVTLLGRNAETKFSDVGTSITN